MRTDARGDVVVEPAQARWVPIAVSVPPQVAQAAGPGAHRIDFVVERVASADGDNARTQTEKSTFVVPR
jgi:hypothetical protein